MATEGSSPSVVVVVHPGEVLVLVESPARGSNPIRHSCARVAVVRACPRGGRALASLAHLRREIRGGILPGVVVVRDRLDLAGGGRRRRRLGGSPALGRCLLVLPIARRVVVVVVRARASRPRRRPSWQPRRPAWPSDVRAPCAPAPLFSASPLRRRHHRPAMSPSLRPCPLCSAIFWSPSCSSGSSSAPSLARSLLSLPRDAVFVGGRRWRWVETGGVRSGRVCFVGC